MLSDEHRFKRAVFVYNLSRVKQLFYELYWCGSYLHSCFEWESRLRSVCALVVFCLATYYFRPYMVPLLLLLIFLKNYVRLCFTGDAANDEQVGGRLPPTLKRENAQFYRTIKFYYFSMTPLLRLLCAAAGTRPARGG